MSDRGDYAKGFTLGSSGIPGFILLVFLGSLCVIAGCIFSDIPSDFYSGSEFEMRITTTEPLTNATFCIPLPVKNGVPMVGEHLLTEKDFGKTGYFINFTDSPPGLDLKDASPVPGGRPVFVCLRTEVMKGDVRYFIPNTSYVVTVDRLNRHDNPRMFFNTLYPVGNESVISPKVDFVLSPPAEDRGKYLPYLIGYKDMGVRYSIPLYADYDASPSAEVSINLDFYVYNAWRQGSSSHSNSYTDLMYWGHRGEFHGWQLASGEFSPGDGVYPDYSHPAWQNTIKEFHLEKNG